MVAKVKSPLVKNYYKVVLIDDASYSGTQAHVLMAYGYKNDGRLKYEKQAGPWAGAGYGEEVEFPPELPHLFNSSGSIDYRETLRKNKNSYTTLLAS